MERIVNMQESKRKYSLKHIIDVILYLSKYICFLQILLLGKSVYYDFYK